MVVGGGWEGIPDSRCGGGEGIDGRKKERLKGVVDGGGRKCNFKMLRWSVVAKEAGDLGNRPGREHGARSTPNPKPAASLTAPLSSEIHQMGEWAGTEVPAPG